MSKPHPAATEPYLRAARAVRRRVVGIRFARGVRRSHWGVALAAIALIAAGRQFLEWREGEVFIILGILTVWLLFVLAVSFLQLPSTLDSLVLLDRSGGWKDRFSSAWMFLQSDSSDQAERLHVVRAQEALPSALSGLPEAIPLPPLRWIWTLPVLALLLAATPLGRLPVPMADRFLTERMKDTAAGHSENLRKGAERMQESESLTDEERTGLEKLRVDVEGMADTLADPGALTSGELLESLEARARAAEKLAEKLASGIDEWASEEMLAEMENHSDTVELALAIRDRAADPAAEEAAGVQEVLENLEITRQTSDRITSALSRIMREATPEDEERPVGERVGNASGKMLDGQPLTAAREFEELAKHFRLLASREETREELEELAESLREAGSEISGSELERMEQLASEEREERSPSEGLQALDAGGMPEDLQNLIAPQFAQSGQQKGDPSPPGGEGEGDSIPQEGEDAPAQEFAEAAGADGEGAPTAPGTAPLEAPVPGEAPTEGQDGPGTSLSENVADGEGQEGMLMAPVPGMEPGESSPGNGLSAGADSVESRPGGDAIGTGTAPLVADESDGLASAAQDSRVEAQINAEGESTVRAVEGQARTELATRSRREIVADFIAAEEQALDGQSLPMSRREHVIRYFSGIRRQFEESDGGTRPEETP